MPCPDSTLKQCGAKKPKERNTQIIATTLITGGLPGFIWGWFHVPDCRSPVAEMGEVFSRLWTSLARCSLRLAARIASQIFTQGQNDCVDKRVRGGIHLLLLLAPHPVAGGLRLFPQDGRLVDLTQALPL
ncbi:MAG: hypothetical protein IPN76_30815 [Saprospiraceae bacterium]|nr:hypothetical protein [Saprospiraceae bacterium]